MQRSWGWRVTGAVKELVVHQSGWWGEQKGEVTAPLLIVTSLLLPLNCCPHKGGGFSGFFIPGYLVPSEVSTWYLGENVFSE